MRIVDRDIRGCVTRSPGRGRHWRWQAMRVSGMHRLLFGAVIGVTGMALAVPVSTLGAGAASTVKVYAPGNRRDRGADDRPHRGVTGSDGDALLTRRARAAARDEQLACRSGRPQRLRHHARGGVVAPGELQRNQQQRQQEDQLQPGVRAARPGPLRRQRLRARAGELGIPDLQDRREDAWKARPMSTISSTRDPPSSPATRAATTTPRPIRGSRPSSSSAAVRPSTASRRSWTSR